MSDDTKRPQQHDYPVSIEDIMHTAYLQYSLSVNVGRAIPDVRDGLKPVNRRILFAMHKLGLGHTHSFTKCAQVVGEVMGKYHPHGDQAIYDTLVRMAQDFSMRHPLIWGQGNFGSIDGDPPAAYRYTECRMQHLAEELLQDLDKDTVDMVPNYDDKLVEPSVLPARFPNLLVNGSTGIGVGMATNIPPHNLAEIIDATVHLIDNPKATPLDLMQFVKGPDLPTGASIRGLQSLRKLYETGRGSFTMRGKAVIEESKTGAEIIVVTEIPYMVNKENLVKKIADLVNDKVIPGISAIQDLSSSRVGIRIVVTVKRNAMGSVVLNQLYKHSQLQNTFGAQFLVVDRNRPRTMNLVQLLQAYIDHRFEVITRRCQFDLAKAEARAHILVGLIIAVDNIDEVIKIIRASRNREEATENLMTRFELSKRQCGAILDMRLNQLTGLAIEELRAEHEKIMVLITYLQDLLAHREKLMAVVKEELIEVRTRYAQERRTEIVASNDDISLEDLIKRHICAIAVTNTGYIKRTETEVFRSQHRGGKGVSGMQTKDGDYVEHLFSACTHDYILFFTNLGQMHWLKVYEIPEGSRISRGKAMINLFEVQQDEQIRSMITVDAVDQEDLYLVFATKNGRVKKTSLNQFKHLRRKGIRAIVLEDDDQLIDVRLCQPEQEIMLFSRQGMACRFKSQQARSMGRGTRGVRGMRLKNDDDAVVAMAVVDPNCDILKITENGMGKRSNIGTGNSQLDKEARVSGYRLTNRGSKGVTSIKLKDADHVVGALRVEHGDEAMVTTTSGQIVRFKTDEIRTIGRASQGVRVMNLKKKDSIVSVTVIAELEEDEDAESTEEGAETAEAGAVIEVEAEVVSDATTDPSEVETIMVSVEDVLDEEDLAEDDPAEEEAGPDEDSDDESKE